MVERRGESPRRFNPAPRHTLRRRGVAMSGDVLSCDVLSRDILRGGFARDRDLRSKKKAVIHGGGGLFYAARSGVI